MPAERAGPSPGGQGKAIPVEETAVQLSLPIATAENPKGPPAGRPGTGLGPSGRERRRRSAIPGRHRLRRWKHIAAPDPPQLALWG
jgi:hypothetical protein